MSQVHDPLADARKQVRQGEELIRRALETDEQVARTLAEHQTALHEKILDVAKRVLGGAPEAPERPSGYLLLLEHIALAFREELSAPPWVEEVLDQHQYHALVGAMSEILEGLGADPARVYAIRTTGVYVTERTQDLYPPDAVEAFEDAVRAYRIQQQEQQRAQARQKAAEGAAAAAP